jgi:aconitate hydratase
MSGPFHQRAAGSLDSFRSRSSLRVDGRNWTIFRIDALADRFPGIARLPYSLKVLLENLLRCEDGRFVRAEDVEALARWQPLAVSDKEIAFTPSRVLLQDFTGVPSVADLAAMREAMQRLGGDPARINPLQPVDLVIDHSVQVDAFGSPSAFQVNAELEFTRNRERYAFLRWGQRAFRNFRVVPPDTGIVHQVNLEYLARVVCTVEAHQPAPLAYPDTLVGTDSHTTMVNGLGVLGWGVGGIEAEAAMLGQPLSLLIPQIVGLKLSGLLPTGATATDLVLTVAELLRRKGVVGKFVELYGEGLAALSVADRATIGNMSPEYGATCVLSPVDEETLRYLAFTGRSEDQVRLVEAYTKALGLFHSAESPEPFYSETVELDLGTVEPSLAGPTRPQDRIRLREAKSSFLAVLKLLRSRAAAQPTPREINRLETEIGDPAAAAATMCACPPPVIAPPETAAQELRDGAVVIAAITSCTNTSNPSVMMAAGLLARKAAERGLRSQSWVKTSLAPGSRVVTDYLDHAGLTPSLERLGFHLVGYGCTTCIGNSGPLPAPVSRAIAEGRLVVAAVLSGNRNFEGRIHPEVRANYLASPPLVVAYALAGRMDFDFDHESLGHDPQGRPIFLRDIWASEQEVRQTISRCLRPEMFHHEYSAVFLGDERWNTLPVPEGELYEWGPSSTYIKLPPYFQDMPSEPPPVADIRGARVLAVLGDSITTDHISPAGSIPPQSPAGRYLLEHGISPKDFNSYGSRRGNHELMMRGTFANVRLKNLMAPGTEGGVTLHLPDGELMPIFDAARHYGREGVPLLVVAGKEYGSGSSRDWAAKGPKLLGVRAVLAAGFERIHRSNLVGMGVLPLQFDAGAHASALGLTGEEVYDVEGLAAAVGGFAPGRKITVRARRTDGSVCVFSATVRIDTPQEARYYEHGGILPYVLRQLLARE